MANREIQELIIKTNFDDLDKAAKAYLNLETTGSKTFAGLSKAVSAFDKQMKELIKPIPGIEKLLNKNLTGQPAFSFPSFSNHPGESIIDGFTKKLIPEDLDKKIKAVEKDLFHNFETGSNDLKNLMKTLKIGSDTFVGTLITGLSDGAAIVKDIAGIFNSISSIGKDFGFLGDIVSLLGFESGGYTGSGDSRRIAGFVHKGEYVWDSDTTNKYLPVLEAIHKSNFNLSKLIPNVPAMSLQGLNFALNLPNINAHRPINNSMQPIYVIVNSEIESAKSAKFFRNNFPKYATKMAIKAV